MIKDLLLKGGESSQPNYLLQSTFDVFRFGFKSYIIVIDN